MSRVYKPVPFAHQKNATDHNLTGADWRGGIDTINKKTPTNRVLTYCATGEALIFLSGLPEPTGNDNLIQTIIQVLIGIATIYKILKDRNDKKN